MPARTRPATTILFESYVESALWSSNDDNGEPLDANYDINDIDFATIERMKADCQSFYDAHCEVITSDNSPCRHNDPIIHAGHDFWLTRNGHGAGFWDGDWSKEAGERLTKASKEYGECNLYVGDDGKIHCQ